MRLFMTLALALALAALSSAAVEEPAVLKLTTTQGRSARISFDGETLSVSGFCEESRCSGHAEAIARLQTQVDAQQQTLDAQAHFNARVNDQLAQLLGTTSNGSSVVGASA